MPRAANARVAIDTASFRSPASSRDMLACDMRARRATSACVQPSARRVVRASLPIRSICLRRAPAARLARCELVRVTPDGVPLDLTGPLLVAYSHLDVSRRGSCISLAIRGLSLASIYLRMQASATLPPCADPSTCEWQRAPRSLHVPTHPPADPSNGLQTVRSARASLPACSRRGPGSAR